MKFTVRFGKLKKYLLTLQYGFDIYRIYSQG